MLCLPSLRPLSLSSLSLFPPPRTGTGPAGRRHAPAGPALPPELGGQLAPPRSARAVRKARARRLPPAAQVSRRCSAGPWIPPAPSRPSRVSAADHPPPNTPQCFPATLVTAARAPPAAAAPKRRRRAGSGGWRRRCASTAAGHTGARCTPRLTPASRPSCRAGPPSAPWPPTERGPLPGLPGRAARHAHTEINTFCGGGDPCGGTLWPGRPRCSHDFPTGSRPGQLPGLSESRVADR